MSDSAAAPVFCADVSREVGEQLFATATRVDVWFALEYDRAFGGDAYPESDLPATVKDHLNAALKAIPRARMQLIRAGKERPRTESVLNFFVAIGKADIGQAPDVRLYHFRVGNYDELLTLDLPKIVAGDPAYAHALTESPLFLICTNGKRDICCAKAGIPVYEQMSAHLKTLGAWESVWMTSHIGGHRFAATGVILPEGQCYGRMDASVAAQVVDAHRAGDLLLAYHRGWSAYDEPVQAADYYLRQQTGLTRRDALRIMAVEAQGADRWRVTAEAAGATHHLDIVREVSTFQTYKNSTDAAGTTVPQFSAVIA